MSDCLKAHQSPLPSTVTLQSDNLLNSNDISLWVSNRTTSYEPQQTFLPQRNKHTHNVNASSNGQVSFSYFDFLLPILVGDSYNFSSAIPSDDPK